MHALQPATGCTDGRRCTPWHTLGRTPGSRPGAPARLAETLTPRGPTAGPRQAHSVRSHGPMLLRNCQHRISEATEHLPKPQQTCTSANEHRANPCSMHCPHALCQGRPCAAAPVLRWQRIVTARCARHAVAPKRPLILRTPLPGAAACHSLQGEPANPPHVSGPSGSCA